MEIRPLAPTDFVAEGVRRSSVSVRDARWDTAIFGLLRSERLLKSAEPHSKPETDSFLYDSSSQA